MTWVQIVNLIASLVIIWFVYSQRKKVDVLQTTVSSQKTIIDDMKSVVDTFRAQVELHKQIIEMHKEKSDLEKEKALRELDQKWKTLADKSVQEWTYESRELFKLALDFIYAFSFSPEAEKIINKMADDSITKLRLLEEVKKSSKGWYGEFQKAMAQVGAQLEASRQQMTSTLQQVLKDFKPKQ